MLDERLTQILQKILKNDEIILDDDAKIIEDYGLSSLQVMFLIVEIEDELNISMDYKELSDIKTIGELKEKIKKLYYESR